MSVGLQYVSQEEEPKPASAGASLDISHEIQDPSYSC